MTDARPVVALDLDGVLNPTVRSRGFVAHDVVVPRRLLADGPYVRRPAGDGDLHLTVHAAAHLGAWVNALRERAEVVWATTWEHAANEVYGPLIDVTGLRVVEHSRYRTKLSFTVADWKARALAEEFAGRPLCWVDDQAWGYSRAQWRAEGEPTLVVVCDEHIGAVAAVRDAVDAFVDAHQP